MKEIIKVKEIIAISDTHSDFKGLKKMQNMLSESNHDTHFVFNGDFIDRGRNSYKSFKILTEMSRHKNFHMIIGNHDEFIYRALGIMPLKSDIKDSVAWDSEWLNNMMLWVANGGVQTIEQLVSKDRYSEQNYAELKALLMQLYTVHMMMDERMNTKIAIKYRKLLREIISFYDGDLIAELRELYNVSTYKKTFELDGKIIGFCHSGNPDDAFATPEGLINDYVENCDIVVMGHWGIHHAMRVFYPSRYVQIHDFGFFKELDVFDNKVVMIDSGCQTFEGLVDRNPKRNIVMFNKNIVRDILAYETEYGHAHHDEHWSQNERITYYIKH